MAQPRYCLPPDKRAKIHLQRETEHNRVLEKRLTTLTAEYIDLHERHAHCLHERIHPAVKRRTLDTVEAATLLNSGYSYTQPELDESSYVCKDVDVDILKQKVIFRDDDFRFYVVPHKLSNSIY